MNLLSACRETARRTFRIHSLRPEQELAMLAVLNGRDAFVSLPTGFGKSLIYQVPAMIVDRPTIVISPLIALMTDQERALKKRGVPVVAIYSRLRAAERRDALEGLEKGGRLVVLTTPETFVRRDCFLVRTRAAGVLCIDEAHCISEWGHDSRPSYLRLGNARKRLGNPAVLALTATATPRVREDIADRLRLDNPRVPWHRRTARTLASSSISCLARRSFPLPPDVSSGCSAPESSIAPPQRRWTKSRAPSAARASRSRAITGRCALPIVTRHSASS